MAMGPQHRALQRQYVEDLRAAVADVRTWWDDLVRVTVEATGTRVAAAAELEKRWPAGPSAHPRILAVIHRYYIACDNLNARVRAEMKSSGEPRYAFDPDPASGPPTAEPDGLVPPGVFVGESLVTAETQDLAKIIRFLTYWPVGVDSTGQFV